MTGTGDLPIALVKQESKTHKGWNVYAVTPLLAGGREVIGQISQDKKTGELDIACFIYGNPEDHRSMTLTAPVLEGNTVADIYREKSLVQYLLSNLLQTAISSFGWQSFFSSFLKKNGEMALVISEEDLVRFGLS